MAKNIVSIPLEEYKELLLREKPTDKDRELLKRILDIVEPKLEYTEDRWNFKVMENVKLQNADEVAKEIFIMLKYVDFDKYMEIWNKVMTAERKRKEQEEIIKQMKQAKEIRKENE